MKNIKFLNIGLIVVILIPIINVFSQTPIGLDEPILNEIKNSFQLDRSTRSVMNAISNNDVKKIAFNREFLQKHNNVFNVKTDAKGITDQKSSGRCWMFAGLNLMRPIVMKKYKLSSFEFSQAYLFFWDKLEKANFFLEAIIETREKDIEDRELQTLLKSPIADGGWWNYFVNLIEKYGAVPKEIMPESVNSSKSIMMNELLVNLLSQTAVKLRQNGKNVNESRQLKIAVLKQVFKLLVVHLGVPPEDFVWRCEDEDGNIITIESSPKTFYEETVGLDLKKYLTLFNYPVHPYDQHYQLKYCRNMFDMSDMNFINLDIDHLKTYTLKSLLNNDPVWFAADTKWNMERKHGIMKEGIYDFESLFDIKDTMTKAERIQYFTSTPNHAMVFVAVDTVKNIPVKWRVENSWGEDTGEKGYFTMYNSWFDNYVYTIVIHQKYLPEKVIALLETKPKILPVWDPMRNSFEYDKGF